VKLLIIDGAFSLLFTYRWIGLTIKYSNTGSWVLHVTEFNYNDGSMPLAQLTEYGCSKYSSLILLGSAKNKRYFIVTFRVDRKEKNIKRKRAK